MPIAMTAAASCLVLMSRDCEQTIAGITRDCGRVYGLSLAGNETRMLGTRRQEDEEPDALPECLMCAREAGDERRST